MVVRHYRDAVCHCRWPTPVIKQKHRRIKVEFVFDYRDLLDISDIQTNPQNFVAEELQKMKAAGISSMAVYESTLAEFKESRRI